jgi:hypothetical protein
MLRSETWTSQLGPPALHVWGVCFSSLYLLSSDDCKESIFVSRFYVIWEREYVPLIFVQDFCMKLLAKFMERIHRHISYERLVCWDGDGDGNACICNRAVVVLEVLPGLHL